MARKLADYGIRSVVFDPIGSGESPPIYRTLETELSSLNAVIDCYRTSGAIAICAHSLSANLLYKYITTTGLHKFLIAPILDIGARRAAWKIQGENISRHGLNFSSDFLNDDRLASFDGDINVDYYFGTCDRYVDHQQIEGMISKEHIHFIDGAGHNFSEGNTSNELLQQIAEDILGYSWQCNKHKSNSLCITKTSPAK